MSRQLIILLTVFSLLSVASLAAGTNDDTLIIRNVERDGEEYRLQHDFNVFKHKFNKVYASQLEELFRFSVFKANMRQAMHRRNKFNDPLAAVDGFTRFSDMTAAEYMKHLGLTS